MLRLTREQVREIDRRAIEDFHIPGIVLMENAARAVAEVALRMVSGIDAPCVMIFCGGGNNGGDGLAAARHLHNRNVFVWLVVVADTDKYTGEAAINWNITQAMKLSRIPLSEADVSLAAGGVELVIDALFGTGLKSPPRDVTAIEVINRHPVPVLAIDLPSGLDCDTGQPLGACVRATKTVTFVAEKAGFANPASKEFTGEITVGDIGVPRELIEEVAKMSPP